MYLSELNIWNFRKYGIDGESFEKAKPGVSVSFCPGLNVLIGENDSGKSTIVDAIRYVLGTQSGDWLRIEETDFHEEAGIRAQELKVECVFRGMSEKEAGQFLEWLGTEETGGTRAFVLKVRLIARQREDRIVTDIRSGADSTGTAMDGDARALLRVTYLKPLRDADAELTPGRRSRFAQILKAHSLFQKQDPKKHELEAIVDDANNRIKGYFGVNSSGPNAGALMQTLKGYVDAFFPESEDHAASVQISGGDLADILQRLSLLLDTNPAGLGAANLLFMAAELLLLQSDENLGLKLALIEELEAHLHPQAQLRLIAYLREKSISGQYILTTHSTTLGSSVPLGNLIICKDTKALSMADRFTMLEAKNYGFLERFLDATKANLFFARGVILVEGDAENLLVPAIANIIDRPLHRYGVSIVNVGSKAFAHYVRIFHRRDARTLGIRVALVTDMDVKPLEARAPASNPATETEILDAKAKRRKELVSFENSEVKTFVSPNWTLEYEILLSAFKEDFYRAALWAEKLSNSLSGVPADSKADEVDARVSADLSEWRTRWKGDPREAEKIAYAAFHDVMLAKEISKAVTAQVFAESLDSRIKPGEYDAVKSTLAASESLQYILDSIYFVTKPKDGQNDA